MSYGLGPNVSIKSRLELVSCSLKLVLLDGFARNLGWLRVLA